LTADKINAAVKQAEYAVRGAIPIRAEELRKECADGKDHGFDEVISCNIGALVSFDAAR
jgi:alanine transaminase